MSLSISDHSLIYCVLKAGVPKATPRTIKYRSFIGFDENAFIQDLKNVPWHIVDDENNVNDAILTWNKLFTEVADSHAPLKKRRVKGTTAPISSGVQYNDPKSIAKALDNYFAFEDCWQKNSLNLLIM